ncbi:FAD-binding protein [Desulfohalobiaceae bacterium Ax17]|uniref:FAD-binding oxidoreductase n=1 Tax=Desulfovulcanus ferrireducens TaxID=2831190 RepID=UPI00207BA28E|nr:FAD-binding protein [Desulfovulcanus ferrireducens]
MSCKQFLKRTQIKNLKSIFPPEDLLLTPEQKLIFGTDSSRMLDMPWAVVRPKSPEQVRDFLYFAQKERIPVFPRARATNMVGACVPRGGGIVLSLLKLNRILDLDEQDFVAVVEPGVITYELQKALAAKGLFYPPDPASVRISTIGGNVSTNAGGMRALKYGVTRDYVLGLEVVLPGGKLLNLGSRCHKNVVGLDLTRLFIGSEGTLGVFTRIYLKVLPKPPFTASFLVGFSDLDQALDTVQQIFQAGILPTALEIMPDLVLKCIEDIAPVPWPKGTNAVLLIKLDGHEQGVKQNLVELEKICAQASVRLKGLGKEEEELWELRRLINPASFKLRPTKMSEDITVPRGKIKEAMERIKQVGQKYGLPILTFGHIGDGNIHTNIMYDVGDDQEAANAQKAKKEILRIVLGLGGTLSGEHGIGLTKAPFISWQVEPEVLMAMRQIKKVFDPYNIMNPGKGY